MRSQPILPDLNQSRACPAKNAKVWVSELSKQSNGASAPPRFWPVVEVAQKENKSRRNHDTPLPPLNPPPPPYPSRPPPLIPHPLPPPPPPPPAPPPRRLCAVSSKASAPFWLLRRKEAPSELPPGKSFNNDCWRCGFVAENDCLFAPSGDGKRQPPISVSSSPIQHADRMSRTSRDTEKIARPNILPQNGLAAFIGKAGFPPETPGDSFFLDVKALKQPSTK